MVLRSLVHSAASVYRFGIGNVARAPSIAKGSAFLKDERFGVGEDSRLV